MFDDPIKAKALFGGFGFYLVTTFLAMIVVVRLWIPQGVDASQLKSMAEADPTLLAWQVALGNVLGIAAGAVACWLGGGRGLRNAAALGGLFVLYGVLGIYYLHPGQPAMMQVGKILSPVPLTMLGGWMWWKYAGSARRR